MHHVVGLTRATGMVNAMRILFARSLGSDRGRWVRSRHSAGGRLLLRPSESDLFVASQVFGWQEYDIGALRRGALNALARTWRDDESCPVIVDGGANVGYSSLYFAEAYPDATVFALEPNPLTFAVLKRNVEHCPRILPVHAALWSHDSGVEIEDGGRGSWSDRVAEGDAASKIPSVTLEQLVARLPHARPLIIKLDIEGSEREVCRASQRLLRSAPCIIVEPHDFMLPGAGNLVPLFAAIAGKEVDTLLIGENLVIADAALATNGSREGADR